MSVATILKHPIQPGGVTRINGHVGARPISAGPDTNGTPSVWFETHGDNGGSCDIEILTLPTGREFDPHGWMFIDTYSTPDGVWHTYWKTVHR